MLRRSLAFFVLPYCTLLPACGDDAAATTDDSAQGASDEHAGSNADASPPRDDSPSTEPAGDAGHGSAQDDEPTAPAASSDEDSAEDDTGSDEPSSDATQPADGRDASAAPDPEPSDYDYDDPPRGDYPILFVAQVPIEGFTTYSSAFGNHRADVQSAPRGGDLMLRYPDGSLRNLTQEAGFGSSGEQQDENAIAVREPCVHWSGTKAVFSMVVGGPAEQYEYNDYRWQLYEVTGLEPGDEAVVTKVENQPDFNNVSPIYATDGQDLLFTSDRPRTGLAHHYPQLDEYESAPTVTGIYRLTPSSGELQLIEQAPSGAFSLSIDSYGRVIFTKWDHLQRDQQAIPDYSPLTFSDESTDATATDEIAGQEVFPEARENEGDVSGHRFNHFFPWEVNEDGTAEETLNHVGRHEFGGSYTEGSFMDDPNLTYYSPEDYHANTFMLNDSGGTFHLVEDPRSRGTYVGTLAPEFYTAGGGRLVSMTGAPSLKGDQMKISALTAEDGGHYRDPLPLHNGTLIAAYTAETADAAIDYSDETVSNYDYRLYRLEADGDSYAAAEPLTAGIEKRVTWWDPDYSYTWDGPLWELDPVEVVARPAPSPRVASVEPPEQAVFDAMGVDVSALKEWLVQEQLALIVMRNVTLRDRGDLNQPFNLRVPGGAEAIASDGKVYDISHLQIFQAEALRGYDSREGRRLLARPMSETTFTAADAPQGSVAVGVDGSVAAFVPAERALSWQLVDPEGAAVVRERNWLSFRAGEIRSCPVCHGLNSESQLGTGLPENEPEALRDLLGRWQENAQ